MFGAGAIEVLLLFLLYVIFWVAIIAGTVYLAVRLALRRTPSPEGSGPDALDLLKERYARGEISRDEFEHMRYDIE